MCAPGTNSASCGGGAAALETFLLFFSTIAGLGPRAATACFLLPTLSFRFLFPLSLPLILPSRSRSARRHSLCFFLSKEKDGK